MRVLLLTNYYPPEIGGAAHLLCELAESLAERGYQTTVVTGFPRYNVTQHPDAYRGRVAMWETVNGVRILRLWIPSMPRRSPILRGLEHFLAPSLLLLGGLFAGPQDAVLTYSPPLPLGLAVYGLGRVKRMPCVVNIQDLFPKEAVMLGLLKSGVLIRLFEAIERFVYRKADCIAVHSPGNREYVIAHGGRSGTTLVIHNWVDVARIQPSPRENAFSREHALSDRFVVSYVGTMGWCQDMLIIVQAAQLLRDQPDILFLMVGDGPEKSRAEERCKQLGLENVVFLPLQPWARYPDVLAASDVSMINLNENLGTPAVPSKLLSIMAAGRPVMASLPLDGDAPRIIEEAGAGLCVGPNDAAALAAAVLRLYRDQALRRACGARGRQYVEAHFSRQACMDQYETLLAHLVGER